MPQVKFSVSGNDLTSYFDRVKQKGNDLSNGFIENAKREASSAKEQIKLIQDQQAALEKRNRTAAFHSELLGKSGYEQRIQNQQNRDALLEDLHRKNEDRFQKGEIGQRHYETNQGRIDSLINRNSESSIAADYKDFLKKEKDRFREQQIQTKLSKETIDSIKQGAKDNVTAVKSGDAQISDIIQNAKTPEEQLAAQLAKEQLDNERKKKNGIDGLGGLISGAALTAGAVKLINGFAQFTQTKNGFDLIQAKEQFTGGIIGSVVGSIAGGLLSSVVPGVGTAAGIAGGGAAGASIGNALGGATGGLEQRKALAMQDYLAARNRYTATTNSNRNFSTADMANMGVSQTDFINMIRETARTAAYATNASKYATDAVIAEKGYGVDQGTSYGIIELQRSTKESNRDLAKLIGGILDKGSNGIFKGGDQTFLNEFLGKFSQLQKDLLKTQTTVASGTTMDILQRFDAMGGQFASRDPRSLGLIEGINSALSNPANDNLKAASFMALRKANPNLDYFDLLKEQQKGLGSPAYMKSMLEFVNSMGGDQNMKKINIAKAFGLGGNLAAAETIYNNQDKILSGKFSTEELSGMLQRNKATDNTTVMESGAAKISDGLLKTWDEAVKVMSDSFKNALYQAANGMVIQLNANGQYELRPVKNNRIPSATKAQRSNGLNYDNTPDMRSGMNRSI